MTQIDPSTEQSSAPKPPRKSPISIPWREIACRLAEGARPAAIAAELDLKEDRIWRHLRQSLRFRFYLRQALERQQMLAGLQLAAIGQSALLARGLKPDSLDGDLLRLLAEAPPGATASGTLAKQIERLGETGGPPPNMAWRARLAAERRQMDMAAAEAMGFVAGLQAGKPRPVRSEPVPTKAREAERSETNASEAQRSATNLNEAERSTSEAARSAAKPDEAAPAAKSAEYPRRPPRPPAEPPLPAIVDLPGPDLARLRAAGHLPPAPGDG